MKDLTPQRKQLYDHPAYPNLGITMSDNEEKKNEKKLKALSKKQRLDNAHDEETYERKDLPSGLVPREEYTMLQELYNGSIRLLESRMRIMLDAKDFNSIKVN